MKSETARRFVRYQGVGLASFLVDLIVLAFLMFLLDTNYLLATAVGFTAAVVFSFFINRHWAFRKWVHIGRIAVAAFVGFTTLMIVLFVTWVGVTYIQIPYLEARAGAALIAAVVSYIGDSLFTFEMEPFE